jgi:hypothetical protein
VSRPPTEGTPEERLDAALKKVLAELESASPAQRAFLLKRAGDICVSLDEQRRALGWYGRAVDQLMELGEAEEAARVCRLIIFVQPEAVRARCTLTWIAIGREQHAEALQYLGAYAEAARQAGQTALAAQQMEWMFDATPARPLRDRIVFEMCTLGDSDRADALVARLAEPPPPALHPDRLWSRVLDATVGAAALTARTRAR